MEFPALVCVIAAGLLVAGSTQEMLPVISTHPASDIYPESTPSQPIVVLLTCIADGEDTLAWLYNGTPVSESDPDRTVGPSSLTIPQFSAALAGEYSCQASNSVGTVTSAIAMIQAPVLQGAPHSTNPSAPHQVTTPAGRPVILDCGEIESVPDSSIEWEIYDASSNFQITAADRAVVGLNGSLYLQNPMESQSRTVFECTVENRLLSQVFRGYIEIMVTASVEAPPPPHLLAAPTSLNANVEDPLFLECILGGSPLPDVTWSTPLMDHSRVILEEFGTRLRLRALLREDAGTYTCMAGAEMYSATVAIRDPPSLTTTIPPLTEVVYGSQTSLECGAEGLDLLWRWYHNGTCIAGASSPTLTVPVSAVAAAGIGETDAGVYQCFATNLAGVEYSATIVDVLTMPAEFIVGGSLPSSDLAFVGRPFEFTCSAMGAPPPSYLWMKEGIPLNMEAFDFSLPGVLTINDVASTHAGNYTCTAVNKIGERVIGQVTSTAELSVIERTVITNSLHAQRTTQLGMQATLPCEASFDSEATVSFSWTVNGSQLVLTERVMFADPGRSGNVLIIAVQYGDAGVYQCSVETEFEGLPAPLVISVPAIVSVSATPIGPTILSVSAQSATSIEVRWRFSGAQSSLTGFAIELRPSDQSTDWELLHEQTTAPITSVDINDLRPFTLYDVRVLALYVSSGDRVSSGVAMVMTETAVPFDAPSSLVLVQANNTVLLLSWTAPTQPNGIITSYEVQFSIQDSPDDAAATLQTPTNATTFNLTGLAPRTTYLISVAAHTSAGRGPFSEEIEEVTIPTGTLVEPNATDVYQMAWFIAVLVVVGVIVLVLLAGVAVLIKYGFSRKHKTRKYHISGYFGGGRHSTDSPHLDDDAAKAYVGRNRRTEINMYGSDGLDSVLDRESSLGDSQYTPQLSASSAARLMGQMAPSYINPPSFQEAVSLKQRGSSPYSDQQADSELGLELRQVHSSPQHDGLPATEWSVEQNGKDGAFGDDDEIDVPPQHGVFIPNGSTQYDYGDESDSVEKPYYSSSRSSDENYSVKEPLPVVTGNEVENFATFV